MNIALIAVVAVLMLGVGVYIGVSGLATQYAIEPSGGSAAGAACAPQAVEAHMDRPVRFAASGLAAGTRYHWASDQGRSEVAATGALDVRFATPGQKTVYLFYATNGRWYRTACGVVVR